jgi:nicotinamide-nucleotide amidase
MKKSILAELLTIGDEILFGQTTNTNAQWMSDALDKIGIKVVRQTTIGDVAEDILHAFKEAEARADIVLITGGLGPTKDDITKKLLADYFDSKMAWHDETLVHLEQLFDSRGRQMNEINKKQALQPEKCTVLKNPVGTAPGMWFERNGKVFVSMPGVPYEMKRIMTDSVLPQLHDFFDTPIIYHKSIKTAAIPESTLAMRLEEWELALPKHIKLAYLPSFGEVRLRLTASGQDKEELIREVEIEIEKAKEILGKDIYGYDQDKLTSVIGSLLKKQNKTIATAESCTGGLVAHHFTEIAGCSAYFSGSVVAYSNAVKISQLNVKEETLKDFGAVSEETAKQMAEGVRKALGTSVGIATTGIAGPEGGTAEKPVGTIWIAYSDEKETVAKKLQLTKNRHININLTTTIVLEMARRKLFKYE